MPDEVRRAKYNAVKVTVLVDTLGRPDMRTFKVVKTTHPWLASSVKTAVAKWRFEPAQLAGCKVPRQFEWGATSGKAPRA
jgi:outer membrane biosynthesis protein TonB